MARFLEGRVYPWILSAAMTTSFLAMVPQLHKAITASNVEGLSIASFSWMAIFQVITALEGIRTKRFIVFVSRFANVLICLMIVMVVALRTFKDI